MIAVTQTQLQNPFPGLRPFRFEESHLYFGRERHTARTIEQLMQNHFISIVGASGVGKSSFVYCGIVHTLLNQYQEEARPWRVLSSTPADEPIMRLARTLAPIVNQSIAEINDRLRDDEMALSDILREAYALKNEQYLLFFDQFEEVFRHGETKVGQSNESTQYIQLILQAALQKDLPAYVIITMRSEFLDNCTQYPALAQFLNQSQFLLPRMTKAEIRDALTKPIALLGADIESLLVEKVLQDTGESSDQLPIMQHAMMRTWDRWSRTSAGARRAINIGEYEAIGTTKTALSVHANEVFAKLNDKEKKICENVFKTITEKGSEGRGTRRPTKLNIIAEIAEAPVAEVANVVHAFRQASNGLLMPSEEIPLTEDTVIDISHESLMRIWEELGGWADQEAESVKTYLRLAEAAERFQQGKDGLWVQPNLQFAVAWREEQNPSKAWGLRHEAAFERTMLFLGASEQNYEKEQINKEKAQKYKVAAARSIAISSIVAVIVCVLFLLYALYQSQEAEIALGKALIATDKAKKSETKANDEKGKAVIATNKAKESAIKAKKSADAAEIAAHDAEIAAKNAERAKLVAELAQAQAKIETDKANKQKRIADINTAISAINSQIASLEKKKAQIAKDNVENLQKLSIAKTLALKSVRFADPDLQAIAAQQAYLMNTKLKGKANDPDVYQGLYYAIKTLKSKDKPTFNQLTGHASTVRSLVSANGLLYSTGSDGKVLAWNLEGKSYAEASTITPIPLTQVQQINRSMAVSSSGLIAVAGEYNEILIFQNSKLIKRMSHKASAIWYMGFGADGKTLISIDDQKTVSSWNINEPEPKPKQLTKSNEKINALSVSPREAVFAVGKETGEITLLDFNGTQIRTWAAGEAINALAYNNAGDRLASGDEGGVLKIWNTTTGLLKDYQKEHRARINHVTFSKDDSMVASAGFDRVVRIWNAKNLNEIPIVLDDHNDWVWSIAFSPDGKKLLAGCRDNVLRVWATQVEDMKDIICPEVKARKQKLTVDEWERFIYKVEDKDAEPACTCCQ